jgi:flavin reductase (DIM6/NTAB) family NADH-FMN oxidoreductase RutF
MFHELGQAMLVPPVHRFQPRTSPPRAAEATEKTFREAMRHLAGGVCIVTVGAGGDRAGVTATSVSSLCAEPPTLLVCVNRASPCYAALTRFGAFAVNVLSADQREFAERFASGSSLKQSERFRGGRWLALPSGAHCLADSIAVFGCDVEERIERHTHAIVIGRVRCVLAGGGSGALVHWRGSYDQVGWGDDEVARAIGLFPRPGPS